MPFYSNVAFYQQTLEQEIACLTLKLFEPAASARWSPNGNNSFIKKTKKMNVDKRIKDNRSAQKWEPKSCLSERLGECSFLFKIFLKSLLIPLIIQAVLIVVDP